jgi:hypothetical protein
MRGGDLQPLVPTVAEDTCDADGRLLATPCRNWAHRAVVGLSGRESERFRKMLRSNTIPGTSRFHVLVATHAEEPVKRVVTRVFGTAPQRRAARRQPTGESKQCRL